MKKLRKNVDLDIETIAVLQIEATIHGFGTLKTIFGKDLKGGRLVNLLRANQNSYSQITQKRISELEPKQLKSG